MLDRPRKLDLLVCVAAVMGLLAACLPFDRPRTAGAMTAAEYCADAEEAAFLSLINAYRVQNGKGALAFNLKLSAAAEHHSVSMAENNYFSHDLTPEGIDWFQNILNHGYGGSFAGENIAAGTATASAVMSQWKNSPAHNSNMLDSGYAAIGIGRAYRAGTTYGWYWTTTFGNSTAGGVASVCGSTPPTPSATLGAATSTATSTATPTPAPSTATPTPAPSTATATPTGTPTTVPATATEAIPLVPTSTETGAATATPPSTAVPPTATMTATPTATGRATQSATPSATATSSTPPTATSTPTVTGTATAAATADSTATVNPTAFVSPTTSLSRTASPSPTAAVSPTSTLVPPPPAMTLSKTKSKFNGAVDVALEGFAANDAVTLRWLDGTVLAVGTTDGAGSTTVSFRTPLVALGTYRVEARDESGHSAAAHLAVIPRILLNEESGPTTTRLRVYFYGFAPGELVEVRWYAGDESSYVVVVTVPIASNGRGSSLVTIPSRTPGGAHKVMGRVVGVSRSASTTFVVTAGGAAGADVRVKATPTPTATSIPPGRATSTPVTSPTPPPAPVAEEPTVVATATPAPTATDVAVATPTASAGPDATSPAEPTATASAEPTSAPDPTSAPTIEPTAAPATSSNSEPPTPVGAPEPEQTPPA